MKPIRYHRVFEKRYAQRIARDKKLSAAYDKRYLLFVSGERGYPLDDHMLTGTKKGLRAFSISGDLRVVYRETETYYEFIDIGSHNQVY